MTSNTRLAQTRFGVVDDETWRRVLQDPLPLGLVTRSIDRSFHRDIYFDTDDGTLEKRGVSCRVRLRSDDHRILSLYMRAAPGHTASSADAVFEAEVPETDPAAALSGTSAPARRLQAVVDPRRLLPQLELETERVARVTARGPFGFQRIEVICDTVTVRAHGQTETFREVKLRRRRGRRPTLDELSRAFMERYPVRSILTSKAERARRRLRAIESSHLANVVRGSREVVVLAVERGRLAMVCTASTMALLHGSGSGEAACWIVLRGTLDTDRGRLRLLGTASRGPSQPLLEVWIASDLPDGISVRAHDHVQWLAIPDVISRVGSPILRDPATLSALAVATRSDVWAEEELRAQRMTGAADTRGYDAEAARTQTEMDTLSGLERPSLPEAYLQPTNPVPDQFINPQLSWLEFNARVLALAEDPGTPLLERLQFLSIFSANLDEFFMVRIGSLRDAIARGVTEPSEDGMAPVEELSAILVRLTPLITRQHRVWRDQCRPDLERVGVRIRRWSDLSDDEQTAMRGFFDTQLFPMLTPQAMTEAPGHPFPHLANLCLSLAVMVRDGVRGPVHFAHARIPQGVARFVPLPNGNDFIPVEEVVAANVSNLYRGRTIEAVHAFRITRAGEISVDEEHAANLLQAVEEKVRERPYGAVVRLEIDRATPPAMRDFLQREVSVEEGRPEHGGTRRAEVIECDGLVDLGALHELASLPMPEHSYPPFTPGNPLDPTRSVFELIRERDILVHHPYDSFVDTVERFIVEAADDPAVAAIKMTLYRGGSQSTIVDALIRAAAAGKDVSVFVELKARFDEERNIHWAKKLEAAGIHVVTGLVRLKTHAKITLVARREGPVVRRYVHVGTGNYNASTAKAYTDLGLLSCDEELGADLNDLFNAFTGTSAPPREPFRRFLVAPHQMLPRFLEMIEREIAHATAGRPGRMRIKVNGLADHEIIAALYRASQAGVQIDLIVRGICSLRPGVPGLSERIRVCSILGRFLEHARIYHFHNGGADEYFIGSADWRPRNLRRRVEVVTPVRDPAACRRLDEILESELEDPMAWQMRSDGGYVRRPPPVGVDRVSTQERLSTEIKTRSSTA